MANPTVISEIRWGWETAYTTEQTTKDKAFGRGTKLTSLVRGNNIEAVYGLGLRNAQKLAEKQFGGALSVEFTIASPWFIRGVTGKAPSVSSNDPISGLHTWTFAESDTVDSMSIDNELLSDTKSVAAFLGAKINTCVITAEIGQLVKVRLDMLYADETEDTSQGNNVEEGFELYSFAFASLEFPNGTTINDIQSLEITMVNNLEMVYGLGARTGQQLPPKNRAYTGRITRTFEDAATFLEEFYGSATGPVDTTIIAETATMELVLDNGISTSNTGHRSIKFLFTGVKIDEHNMPQDITALIIEDMPIMMRSLAVTAINATATEP